MSKARPGWARLGDELRRLRVSAKLSQYAIAKAIGASQPTVARMEAGEAVPAWRQVRAWVRECQSREPGLAPVDMAALRALTDAALHEVTPFRVRLRDGLAAMQRDVRALEATTRTLRNFEPAIIPGLLQTAAYAQRVLDFYGDGQEVALAVQQRMDRQVILFEPGREFEFLVTEASLRFRPGGGDVLPLLRAQLSRLEQVVTSPGITFGVIPSDAVMHTIPRGFVLYEDRTNGEQPFVIAEDVHGAAYVSERLDVEFCRSQLERLRLSTLHGDEAVAFVREVAESLT